MTVLFDLDNQSQFREQVQSAILAESSNAEPSINSAF
jgi:hypothetical protein